MLVAFSCTKESDEMEQTAPLKIGLAPEAPYEIYEPQGEPYLALENGLLENIGHEATASTCDVTKGIWLWESGLNYWFPSVEFEVANSFVSDFEEEIIDERVIQMNLSGGEFDNQSLRAEFIRTYEDIESRVLGGLAHAVTDVQFVDLQDDVITLRVKSIFYLNPAFSAHVAGPTVPPATLDKMVGNAVTCSGGPTSPAWGDAARNVKSVLPKPLITQHNWHYSNVFEYSSYTSSLGKRYWDGSFLPGNINALYSNHKPPINSTKCLYIIEQNAYAQLLVDQIHTKLAKRIYWDGVSRFVIHSNKAVPSGYCTWGFYLDLATHYFYPTSKVKLSPLVII